MSPEAVSAPGLDVRRQAIVTFMNGEASPRTDSGRRCRHRAWSFRSKPGD